MILHTWFSIPVHVPDGDSGGGGEGVAVFDCSKGAGNSNLAKRELTTSMRQMIGKRLRITKLIETYSK